jgi:pimeloyl-ACP methyl ester carboxylesterase
MNSVPWVSGYRWHFWARTWRKPLLGELAMGFSFKRLMRREMAKACPGGKIPDEVIDRVWAHFDHGTQRAILKLYRSSPPDVLEAAGERLGTITAPALVAWGVDDPYISADFAPRVADALGGPAEVELIEDGRHWSWLGRPDTVELVTDFLKR